MIDFYKEQVKSQLRELGLDPNNVSFRKHPKYAEIKNNIIFSSRTGTVTMDYFIRTELFPRESNEGRVGRFDPESRWNYLSFEANDLIVEIREEIAAELIENGIDEEKKYDDANIKNKLFGTSGLRNNLRERLNFDTFSYGPGHKFEEFQLLKLLYRFEKHPLTKVNITKLLSTLSLENVDKTILGAKSVNGQAVTELLTEVHLALVPSFPKMAKEVLVALILPWQEKLREILSVLNLDIPKEIRIAELQRILDHATQLINKLGEPQPVFSHSLMESFISVYSS